MLKTISHTMIQKTQVILGWSACHCKNRLWNIPARPHARLRSVPELVAAAAGRPR